VGQQPLLRRNEAAMMPSLASYLKLFSIREEALAHAVEKNVEADAFTFLAVRPNDDVASSNRSIKDATYFNPRCHSWPIASFDRLRSKRMPRPQILVPTMRRRELGGAGATRSCSD
jgi:hypothetical protein